MQKAYRLVAALVIALLLALPGAARAQESSPAKEGWGDEKTVGARSRAPAKGESYNWRQMGFAGLVVLCAAGGLVLLVRRQVRKGRE